MARTRGKPRDTQSFLWQGRVLCWFSCGAASAVAAKMAVDRWGSERTVEVCYHDLFASEHPDNRRFLDDVSAWIGRPIKVLKSDRYANIWDLFRGEKFIKGPLGALCTKILKREAGEAYAAPEDVHVFGYTHDEAGRALDYETTNPGKRLAWPLIDARITKSDCYRIVREAGIEIPVMYRMGYRNNNCIGCVKGGMGYWNKVRRDFPESFARMALIEREVGHSVCRSKGEPVFLDQLPEGVGRYDDEPDIECGPAVCQSGETP